MRRQDAIAKFHIYCKNMTNFSVRRELTRLISSVLMSRRLYELKNRDIAELQHLKHLLGLRVDFDDVVLQSGDFGDVVVSAFSLFLLQLDGNAAYLAVTQPLHEMRNKTVESKKLLVRHGKNVFVEIFV